MLVLSMLLDTSRGKINETQNLLISTTIGEFRFDALLLDQVKKPL